MGLSIDDALSEALNEAAQGLQTISRLTRESFDIEIEIEGVTYKAYATLVALPEPPRPTVPARPTLPKTRRYKLLPEGE